MWKSEARKVGGITPVSSRDFNGQRRRHNTQYIHELAYHTLSTSRNEVLGAVAVLVSVCKLGASF